MSEQHDWKDDPRLLAYALGELTELSDSDVKEIERALGIQRASEAGERGADVDPKCREALEEIQTLLPHVERALGKGALGPASGSQPGSQSGGGSRAAGEGDMLRLRGEARAEITRAAQRGVPAVGWGMPLMAAAALTLLAGGAAWKMGALPGQGGLGPVSPSEGASAEVASRADSEAGRRTESEMAPAESPKQGASQFDRESSEVGGELAESLLVSADSEAPVGAMASKTADSAERVQAQQPMTRPSLDPGTPPPSSSAPSRTARAPQEVAQAHQDLKVSKIHFEASRREELSQQTRTRAPSRSRLSAPPEEASEEFDGYLDEEGKGSPNDELHEALDAVAPPENPFIDAAKDPFSTFSIDVDTASYAASRASIAGGSAPAKASVRVEEFINYFTYADQGPGPDDGRPFAVYVDTGAAPWAPDHRLVRVGLKARSVEFTERKPCNLVFLVDVSGSMLSENKLPLVKKALAILTESLKPDDRVAIAVYAGREGLALDSTPVSARELILQSLERLEGGGGTDGGKGIRLAYAVAREHFIAGGVNRVVLCTDGDFNVGITEEGELEKLIAAEAESGVELTVLGFSGGSVQGDSRMEALSNRGNGNYWAIDSELEARKVLATEVGGTLTTVAKDVKIQVAWNPAVVDAFRLIGYENRMLTHAEFLDDKKDAGEIGAGHGVTALYEVVLAGGDRVATAESLTAAAAKAEPRSGVSPAAPSSGSPSASAPAAPFSGAGLVEVRVRYKEPGGSKSVGFAVRASDGGASFNGAPLDLRFSAAVAAFAMWLRGSESVDDLSLGEIRSWALESKGKDPGGLREGFIQMVEGMIELRKQQGGK